MLSWLVLAGTWGCNGHPAPSTSPPPFEFFDACDPHAAPDASCYASKRDPTSANVALATEIAHRYITEHPAIEMGWGWREGVLMFAMTELYRVTGDDVVHDYYEDYIDHHIETGYELRVADSCPPALTALALYGEDGAARYRTIIDAVMVFLLERSKRTPEGGISHFGTNEDRVTLWIDSLFMFGMVLDRWGELGPSPQALDEMSKQIDIFSTLLQDPSIGLFKHAYGEPVAQDPGVFWGRGNGWVVQGVVDYLRVRRLRHERDERVERAFHAQLDGILGTQDGSGGWRTVMSPPSETKLETSATGFFGYGMARAYRYGFAGKEVLGPAHAAAEYVRGTIVRDEMDRPIVTGISGPTGVGGLEYYANIPMGQDLDYGVGAAILVLIETSGLPRSS